MTSVYGPNRNGNQHDHVGDQESNPDPDQSSTLLLVTKLVLTFTKRTELDLWEGLASTWCAA